MRWKPASIPLIHARASSSNGAESGSTAGSPGRRPVVRPEQTLQVPLLLRREVGRTAGRHAEAGQDGVGRRSGDRPDAAGGLGLDDAASRAWSARRPTP